MSSSWVLVRVLRGRCIEVFQQHALQCNTCIVVVDENVVKLSEHTVGLTRLVAVRPSPRRPQSVSQVVKEKVFHVLE